MAASTESNQISLYSDLHKYGQISDYEKTLKIANKIIKDNSDDPNVFHFKVISLIQLSKFEEALQVLTKFPKFTEGLKFEKAYAMYRLNKIQESLKVLETVTNPEIKHNELKAQVYYRLERFDECFELYRDVIKQTNDEFDDERQTNLAAIVVNLIISGKLMEMPEFECETFEIRYNIACFLIAKGLYAEAEKTLKQAEKICRESFDDDTPADEIDDELGIIKLQQACCLHFMGRDKEAMSLYTNTLKKKPSDLAIAAVASNNTIAINRNQNLFDSKKKMKSIMSDAVQFKLTSSQKRSISFNHCLLTFYTNPTEQALPACDSLIKKYPQMEEKVILMKASILIKENKLNEAIKILKTYSDSHQPSKLIMSLAIAQLLLNAGQVLEACKVLEDLKESLTRPGLVSAIVSMYSEMGCPAEASKILEKAVSWNQKNKSTTIDLRALWRHAADLHFRNGQAEIAANSLEELLKLNPNDIITLAELIIAYAQFDPVKANSLSEKLPHLVDMTPNFDVDSLETASWIMGMKVIKKAAKVDPSPGTPLTKKKSRSKKKKKLPKNYNPGDILNPERWLPKQERSTYRKKRDKKSKDAGIGKGTQGAATVASDQYDMSKLPTSSKLVQNTPSPPQDNKQRKLHQKRRKRPTKR